MSSRSFLRQSVTHIVWTGGADSIATEGVRRSSQIPSSAQTSSMGLWPENAFMYQRRFT
jgi:hypothetical protein